MLLGNYYYISIEQKAYIMKCGSKLSRNIQPHTKQAFTGFINLLGTEGLKRAFTP